ncbi:MAG: glutamate mutase L [Caldilineaceae bacterium]
MTLHSTSLPAPNPAANLRTGGALTHGATGSILALGSDAHRLRVCLLEPVNQRYRLLAQRDAAHAAGRPLASQLATVAGQLGDSMGRTLWTSDGRGPLMESPDPVGRPPIEHVVGAVTLRPWLRVWLAGLSVQGSLAAAAQALGRAPAQPVGQTVLLADINVSELAANMAAAAPDVLLICGGYEADEAAIQASMLRLAELFVNALGRLPPAQHPVVIYAGNRAAAAAVEQLWRTRVATARWQAVDNMLPQPGRIHLAALVDALHSELQRLSQRTPDFHKISAWLTGPTPLLNTEAAFVRFARAWMALQRLDDLHALLTTPERWLHVRLMRSVSAAGAPTRNASDHRDDEQIELYFTHPGQRATAIAGWPVPRLVSGAWPEAQWPRGRNAWWDRSGIAPILAAVGQISPDAMQQVAEADIF